MKSLIVAAALTLIAAAFFVNVPESQAIDLFNRCTTANSEGCAVVKENDLNYKGTNSVWSIIQFVLGILGGIAVIMIVIGGIKYTVSNGDSAGLNSAKSTILYALIGLVVAIMASGIVLVVTNFFV